MNLRTKKEMSAKALKVGKARITFVRARLGEIKEAITKQDIRDLHSDGAIKIKEVCGRKKVVKRKRVRGPGKIKKKVKTRKQDYVKMVRTQRSLVKEMQKQSRVSNEEVKDMRKKIRNKKFKSKANLRDYIEGLKK